MILKDKVVLVTGVGPGMTSKLCLAAGREGAKVVVTARTESFIEDTAGQINAAGGRAIFERVDVSSAEDCRRAAARALAEFGRIDGLVNSAVLSPIFGNLGDAKLDDVARAYDVNALGALRMIQAVLPAMRAQKAGSIVNVSTMGTRRVHPGNGGYAMAKAALNQLSRTIAAEEGPNNIRANTVAMGLMMGASLERLFLAALSGPEREQALAQMTARIPLGRIPLDADCAKSVMFLLSELASEVTGALLDVNGGEWVAP